MAINKVEANGETLIDLTSDTVTADTLVSGRTAHLASGAQVTGTFEPVTGVKGNAESTYRKGNVNLTPANIGAATSAQGTKADSAVQTIQINGTAQTKTNGTVNLPAYPTKSSLGLGNVDNTSDANKPISTAAQAEFDKQQAQIDYNSNQGVKNLLYTKPASVTWGGVTATCTSPNKYNISGTTTNINQTMLLFTNLSTGDTGTASQYPSGNPFGTGNFILSCKVPEGIFFQILIAKSLPLTTSNYRAIRISVDTPSQPITLDSTDKYVWFRLAYNVSATTTYNDEAEIMMRRAEIEDDTFEPYAEPNYQLTQKVDKALEQIPKFDNNHNGIYRGKDLTNIYTVDEMYNMIHSGNFDDLFLGDYFTKSITTDIYTKFTGTAFESGVTYYERSGDSPLNWTYTETSDEDYDDSKTYYIKLTKTENVTLMFAAFDYYYNEGYTAPLTTHHAVLIPRGYGFATAAKMNSSNTTVGSYFNSDMHQIVLPCYAKALKTVLNNHLLAHGTILPNAINASTPSMAGAGFTGASNNWDFETVELQLMNEPQIYGTTVWSSSAYDVGADYKKLPVFDFINGVQFGRSTYWLRSVVSSTHFANCNTYGHADYNGASYARYVRPLILFG